MRVTVQMNAELRDALRTWQEALRNLEKGRLSLDWSASKATDEGKKRQREILSGRERAAYQRVAALLNEWE